MMFKVTTFHRWITFFINVVICRNMYWIPIVHKWIYHKKPSFLVTCDLFCLVEVLHGFLLLIANSWCCIPWSCIPCLTAIKLSPKDAKLIHLRLNMSWGSVTSILLTLNILLILRHKNFTTRAFPSSFQCTPCLVKKVR
jgi:hypothetical protein